MAIDAGYFHMEYAEELVAFQRRVEAFDVSLPYILT